jgi:excisionase family DNA binding protein
MNGLADGRVAFSEWQLAVGRRGRDSSDIYAAWRLCGRIDGAQQQSTGDEEMARPGKEDMTRPSKTSARVATRAGDAAAGAGRGASCLPGEAEAVLLAEPLLDSTAAAALLNVRVSWVRDAARLGHLPCLRVGRHLRFTRLMLEDWLAAQFKSSPAAGRVYAGTSGTASVKSSPFRRRTQAALLASLAETPKGRGVGHS